MRRNLVFALAVVSCLFLVACGGSMNQQMTPSNAVPMTLTLGDTPPNGVGVLFFEALVTGASLQPSDATKPAVTALTTPVEVEFGHLQTDTAFLSLANVAPDTYQSMTLTFGSATMTIVNYSGAAIGGCANNSVCELTPNFNPTTAAITSTPFPITISANSVVGIRLDFNVASSVQTDLSINPTVTVKNLTQRMQDEDDQEMEEVDEIDGQVTATGMNQFTLMNERSGQSFTITVDSTTMFEDFGRSGCTASPEDFTCVQTGQVLNVDLNENGMGTMLAKRVEFEEAANRQAIKGTITSVDSATQFHMVVFNEEPAVSGIGEGSPVVVTINPNATFQVGMEELGEDGGFSFAGLSFASSADLLAGQDVQIRPASVSSSGGTTTIATDLVRLWPSQVTGQIASIDTSGGTFTLTGLSPLFTGATPPVTTIKVVTLSEMNFEDFSGGGSMVSLAVGNTVSVKGLLFNTTGTPTLVTRTLREDGDH
jgi:Domain of unknown function (DUF5666)